jgi:serine/threonine protein kinase
VSELTAGLLDLLRSALAERYDVQRVLGHGGMAIVFLAHDLKHDRDVAIKVLRPEIAGLLGADRFLREIQIEAGLHHPHIVPLHDSGTVGGMLYYTMPFVAGESLRERLTREQQLPIPDVLAITGEVAEALTYAHAQGVIHRDIKPENILLADGHAWVADFGIARVMSLAGVQQITSAGMAIGTPHYMSPEQSSQTGVIDGRSDVYSLGCVVYEMLTGEPPFTGRTSQAIVTRHMLERPRSLRMIRETVTEQAEQAVERSLAKVPADRFATAREFAQALSRPGAPQKRPQWNRRLLGISLAAVVAIGLLLLALPAGSELDESRYVLANTSGPSSGADSSWSELLIYQMEAAIQSVPDITLQDAYSVSDRMLQAGSKTLLVEDWRRIARELGAGHLLAFRVVKRRGDSVEVLTDDYDVARGASSPRSERLLLRSGTADVGPQIAALVERLFSLSPGAIPARGSEIRAANQAYTAGRKAAAVWNLPLAADRFQDATRLDPDFATASLWLAKVRMWAGEPAENWQGPARNAVGRRGALADAQSRGMAQALLLLSERQFPEACTEFERLVAADSLSFEAWYGQGECLRRDGLVLPDARSPSKWRFRSSYHAALFAYRRAYQIAPSFNFAMFARLPDIVFAEPSRRRAGRSRPPDTLQFRAFPSLEADTIGFVPYPQDRLVIPPTLNQAIERNRTLLLGIVRTWALAFPDSSRALREMSRALELTGHADPGGRPEESAISYADKAERMARTDVDSVSAIVLRVRLLVKLSRYDAAAALADSALTRWPAPEPALARQLAGLAALLGHARQTARLAGLGAPLVLTEELVVGRLRGMELALLQSWKTFEAYAALGAPQDSLEVLATRLEALLALDGRWDCPVRWNALGLAYPELRRAANPPRCGPHPYLPMQSALSRGDRAAVRTQFLALRGVRSTSFGDVAAHNVYHEAWLVLQAGDTSAAIQHLDGLLGALASLRTSALDEATDAAGLVRAMALRADLAAARGDRSKAREWARPVSILWRRADPELQGLVRRMNGLLPE